MIKKKISVLLASAILFTSCASTTIIQSNPSEAKVYVNGESVGTTPYKLRDMKIVNSETSIKLEKEGYEPRFATITKDEELNVGALIGGILVLVPFLWIMKYQPTHTYDLVPERSSAKPIPNTAIEQTISTEKASKLRELKKLLDEKIITQDEFEKEKKKILE